jgi:recombination protein RecA
MYGIGISREGELLDLAVQNNIVDKSGSWFSFDGERLGQGRENSKQFLREHEEFYVRIEEGVRGALGLGVAGAVTPEEAAVAASGNGKNS